jgi:hypothetical protein
MERLTLVKLLWMLITFCFFQFMNGVFLNLRKSNLEEL